MITNSELDVGLFMIDVPLRDCILHGLDFGTTGVKGKAMSGFDRLDPQID